MPVSCHEPLAIHPRCQCGEGRGARGILLEHLRDSLALLKMDMDPTWMFGLADQHPLSVAFLPAGLIAEGDGTQMLSIRLP